MIQELQLRVLPPIAADTGQLRRYVADEKGLALSALKGVRILKRSIDARQRTIFVNLKVRLYINELPTDDEYVRSDYPDVSAARAVIVVGAGPGGLFAALRLIELGLRPIVLERGKDVHERKKDLAAISRTQDSIRDVMNRPPISPLNPRRYEIADRRNAKLSNLNQKLSSMQQRKQEVIRQIAQLQEKLR